MATTLSSLEWMEILQSPEMTKALDLAIFQALYAFEGHTASSREIGRVLGYTHKSPQSPLHLEIGRYAKRIAKHYEIGFTQRSKEKEKFWDLFFNGWERERSFVWQLRAELKEALEATGLTGAEQYAEELPPETEGRLAEGMKKTIVVNSYERNPKARQQCIDHWQAICQVCSFDFEKVYGAIGKGFIHVHHIVPISQIGEAYEIDPVKDLVPVCPNCHAMLHRESPPLGVEALRGMLMERGVGS